VSKYWSRGLAELAAYVPGEQPQDRSYVKLNTNENPYPPSPRVIEAIAKAADEGLRLYPDPTCRVLRDALAARFGLRRAEVFVGNGSDEILAFAFAAFFDHEEPLLYPDITYSFYPVYTAFFRLRAKTVALREDFTLPVEGFLVPNGGVVLPNPNAPTSIFLPLPELERILEHNRGLDRVVVVDEAYVDFGGETAARFLAEYPNLLVVRTLSKSRSLAGLRVGFALGSAELIAGLERVKDSFNSYTLDRLALAGATAAVEDEAYFEETRNKIIATRTWVTRELRSLGFSVADTCANFIFVSHEEHRAERLYAELRKRGVLVRYFAKARIDDHLRVSIGTDAEMRTFLEATREILASGAARA
jgi:histidinol-phosphate aminotransferase